jgi:TetR/AcrR family acrAB operon transcriptional repressor
MKRGLLPRRIPARTAALGLHALIDGLIQNWMLDPEAFDLVKVGQQVLDTYLAGLAVPK